jgi:hypothetical protein
MKVQLHLRGDNEEWPKLSCFDMESDLITRLKFRTDKFPWFELIEERPRGTISSYPYLGLLNAISFPKTNSRFFCTSDA